MVYVTGDCHADYSRFDKGNFYAQNDMSQRRDIVIVLGDFGIWHDDFDERKRLDRLSKKPFTTVFVDGNHENFDRLYGDEFPIVDFHGGKAHKIRDNIYHLMRGHVFEFDGKKFFAFGGASSHDIDDGIIDPADYDTPEKFKRELSRWKRTKRMFRINHVSWWEQELPSKKELEFGLESLESHGNKVDYIISHCCPQYVARALGFKETDNITEYFNKISQDVQFNRWYFGHYHRNEALFGNYICMYDRIDRIV